MNLAFLHFFVGNFILASRGDAEAERGATGFVRCPAVAGFSAAGNKGNHPHPHPVSGFSIRMRRREGDRAIYMLKRGRRGGGGGGDTRRWAFVPPPFPLPLSARTGRSRESRNNVWGGERKSWCVCFVGTDTSPLPPSLPRPERSKVLITLIQALSCPSSSPSTQYDRHPPKGQPTSPLSLSSSDKQERENKFRFPGWKLTWTDRPLDRPS